MNKPEALETFRARYGISLEDSGAGDDEPSAEMQDILKGFDLESTDDPETPETDREVGD